MDELQAWESAPEIIEIQKKPKIGNKSIIRTIVDILVTIIALVILIALLMYCLKYIKSQANIIINVLIFWKTIFLNILPRIPPNQTVNTVNTVNTIGPKQRYNYSEDSV